MKKQFMTNTTATFIILAMILVSSLTMAQPANNNCFNAQVIIPESTCTFTIGTLTGATVSAGVPNCGMTISQDVWYQFEATTETKHFQIPVNNRDLGFEIYEGSCGGSPVYCVNEVGANIIEQKTLNNFSIGTQYFVRIFNNSALSASFFNFCVQEVAEPSNNLCNNAMQITPSLSCTNTPVTIGGSTASSVVTNCGSSVSQDIWFQFEATTATHYISLSAATGVDHGFEIYEGTCSGNLIECVNYSGVNSAESASFNNFNIGVTYFVRVFNSSTSLSTVNFDICIQAIPPTVNNDCVNAIEIIPQSTCVSTTGSFAGSTINQPSPDCALNSSQDVWYQFTATTVSNNIQLLAVSSLDHGFEIYDGSCNGTIIFCRNESGVGLSESITYNDYIVGNLYFIRVFNTSETLSIQEFNICVRTFSTPLNNSCPPAQFVSVNNTIANYVTGNFNGSGPSNPDPSCFINSGQDLWYQFTAPSTSILISPGLGGVSASIGIEIFQGSCNGNIMVCEEISSDIYYGFSPGTVYYFRFFTLTPNLILSNDNGFHFFIKGIPEASNNHCSNAQIINPSPSCSPMNTSFSGSGMNTPPPSCASDASQDIWFQFTATTNTNFIRINWTSFTLDLGFEIYEGSCNGSLFQCVNQNQILRTERSISDSFNIGSTYFIRVFNANSSLIDETLNICVQAIPEPMNNDCACPINLTPNPTCLNLTSTIGGASITLDTPSCGTESIQDVWFQFTATESDMIVNVSSINPSFAVIGAESLSLDLGLELYSGLCSQQPLLCINNEAVNQNESLNYNQFVPGETYYVRVFNARDSLSARNFNICVIGDAPYDCIPSVSITSSIGTNFCLGDEVNFTANSLNGGNNPQFQWQVNGSNVGSNSNSFSTSSLISGDTITCFLTSNSSCIGLSSAISNYLVMNAANNTTPTFDQVGPYCFGEPIPDLPTICLNGISGTWSPLLNNEETTTYTFTSTVGSCVPNITMTIEINEIIEPEFNQVGPYCAGDSIPTLPSSSINNITGTWSPAINNQQTTTYTFTQDIGGCGSVATMTIQVEPTVIPSFVNVDPICEGETLSPLPNTSLESISGSWSPALNNQQTTTYTFTPDPGTCINESFLTIEVQDYAIATFTPIDPICSGTTLTPLPTTSLNNISGTWAPTLNNQETTTYSFTPNAAECSETIVTMTIEVIENVTPIFTEVGPYCVGDIIPELFNTSTNNISGTWSPAINNQETTNYTFTPSLDDCATSVMTTIIINPLPVVNLTEDESTLIATSGFSSYSWMLNGVAISGVTGNIIPISDNGIYEVTVTDNSGCQSSASIDFQSVSIEQSNWSFNVNIYPVPTDGVTYIEIESPNQIDLNFELYDSQGKILKKDWIAVNSGKQLFQFDFSYLATGFYLIRLTDEKVMYTRRLLKN